MKKIEALKKTHPESYTAFMELNNMDFKLELDLVGNQITYLGKFYDSYLIDAHRKGLAIKSFTEFKLQDVDD